MRYVISYIKSFFLTFAIIPIIFVIFFIVTNFFSIDAINYLIALLFKFHLLALDTNNIDTGMVMGIVFKISILLFIISEILRYLFFKLTGHKIIIKTKHKIVGSVGVIIILFLLAIISLPWAKLSNANDWGFFFFLLLLFGGLSSISTLIYFAIDPLVSFIKNIMHSFSPNQ